MFRKLYYLVLSCGTRKYDLPLASVDKYEAQKTDKVLQVLAKIISSTETQTYHCCWHDYILLK